MQTSYIGLQVPPAIWLSTLLLSKSLAPSFLWAPARTQPGFADTHLRHHCFLSLLHFPNLSMATLPSARFHFAVISSKKSPLATSSKGNSSPQHASMVLFTVLYWDVKVSCEAQYSKQLLQSICFKYVLHEQIKNQDLSARLEVFRLAYHKTFWVHRALYGTGWVYLAEY